MSHILRFPNLSERLISLCEFRPDECSLRQRIRKTCQHLLLHNSTESWAEGKMINYVQIIEQQHRDEDAQMSINSMYTMLVIDKVMLFSNRKSVLIICLRFKVWLPQREQGEWKDKTFCPEKQPTSLLSILLCTAVVSALKRVELLLGDLLYPLCSWNFSQAEKSFYISNSIKLNSKALITVFNTTLLLTMGLFPWANPTTNASNALSTFVGCGSTWFKW